MPFYLSTSVEHQSKMCGRTEVLIDGFTDNSMCSIRKNLSIAIIEHRYENSAMIVTNGLIFCHLSVVFSINLEF